MKVYVPVPVTERLPEKDGWYNCLRGEDLGLAGFFYGAFKDGTVTHWLEEKEMPTESEIYIVELR